MSVLLSCTSIAVGAALLAAPGAPAIADEALRRQFMRNLAEMTNQAKRTGFSYEAHAIESDGNISGDVKVYYTLEVGNVYAFGGVCNYDCYSLSLRVFDERIRLVAEGQIGGRSFVVMTPEATGNYYIRLDILGCSAPRCGAAIGFYKWAEPVTRTPAQGTPGAHEAGRVKCSALPMLSPTHPAP